MHTNRLFLFILPILLFICSPTTRAQDFNDGIDRTAEDFVLVSLCVADPTDQSQDYMGVTGHSFLRLQCPTFNLDYCFSYESEKIKGQLWDCITSKLRMGFFAIPTDEYVADYRKWQRAVHEYRIHMPAAAEQRLWELLDNHMMAEQDMPKDLFKYGCANTLLRYVERALLPDTITYVWPEKYYTKSATEITKEYMANYPWTALLINLSCRREFALITAPKQKVLFPADLLEVWSEATIDGEPLLSYVGDLVEAEPVVAQKPWFTPQLCGILLLLLIAGGLAFAIKRRIITHKS